MNENPRSGGEPAAAACRRRSRGLTLIELLIVVLIIGLIASITVPSLQVAMRKAHRAAVAAGAKDLHTALARYCTDNGKFPDMGSFDIFTLAPLSGSGYYDSADSFVKKLYFGRILAYLSFSANGPDSEYWLALASKNHPSLFFVAHTNQLPGQFAGTWYDGVFLYWNGDLVPVSEGK